MKKFLRLLGLVSHPDEINPYTYNKNEYTLQNDLEKIKLHRDFLYAIESDENNRLTLLENKTSQIISQTGIIFALLSLFIPLIFDKLLGQPFIIKSLLLFLLITTSLFYILTINNAIKNFQVNRFLYSKSSPVNVIKYQTVPVADFMAIEVRDLLFSINLNVKTNNIKATNLICAYFTFKIANTFTALLVIFFCSTILSVKDKDPIVKENTSKIQKMDSLKPSSKLANFQNDTLQYKLEYLSKHAFFLSLPFIKDSL